MVCGQPRKRPSASTWVGGLVRLFELGCLLASLVACIHKGHLILECMLGCFLAWFLASLLACLVGWLVKPNLVAVFSLTVSWNQKAWLFQWDGTQRKTIGFLPFFWENLVLQDFAFFEKIWSCPDFSFLRKFGLPRLFSLKPNSLIAKSDSCHNARHCLKASMGWYTWFPKFWGKLARRDFWADIGKFEQFIASELNLSLYFNHPPWSSILHTL